ncbi:MAG TPA: glycosyltransferase family 2 protein [Bacteroidia bacterium]|nr:glycosyltransferase family 2 protein [Bacteroidia bacterium]
MVKLSVVIITYNEEKNIARCLDSVQGVADEIIVVDSFSIDKTEEICKSKGARFYQNKFEGHIEQKNYALKFSSSQYVLSLDADEALDEKLKKSILEVKENWKYDGYEMNRLTNYCGTWIKHSGWYPDRKLRLFDKTKGKWGGTNPHDKCEMQPGSKIGFLKGDLLHYSYYTLDDHYRQIQYFTDISSRELFKNGKRASLFKMYMSPVFKFVKEYIIHLGFLDGKAGWTVCTMSSWATYLKYSKLRELYNAD